jgi:hypothetical protein
VIHAVGGIQRVDVVVEVPDFRADAFRKLAVNAEEQPVWVESAAGPLPTVFKLIKGSS